MKKVIFLLIFICIASTGIENISAVSKSIKIDNIEMPALNTINTKNGLRVFHIKDELPRLVIICSVGFGRLYEDDSNAGISELIAKTLSLAGSKKYPADVLHDTIEKIGGKFSVGTSWEQTAITIEVLDKNTDLAFDILSDLILNPNLDPGIIENARSLLLEDVRRMKDNPEMLGFEKIREIIFNGSGYGSFVTEKSLKSITKNDMEKAFRNFFTAKNIIIGILTPKNPAEVKKNIYKLESVKEGARMDYKAGLSSVISSLPEKSKNIYLLPKDIPQATIIIGTVAPDIKNKSIYSLTIMNDILGGSDFNSRLMKEIREKRGLAYAVQSVIRFRKNTGVFLAYAQTRNETADSALSLLLQNIEGMSKSAVKAEELKLAKDSIKNSYIFEFESPVSILNQYAFLSYNGLDESFLLQYVKLMEDVTEDEIQKSSLELIGKGVLKMIIGKKELEKNLSKFGKVVIINE